MSPDIPQKWIFPNYSKLVLRKNSIRPAFVVGAEAA
jgi:hypothetical protein